MCTNEIKVSNNKRIFYRSIVVNYKHIHINIENGYKVEFKLDEDEVKLFVYRTTNGYWDAIEETTGYSVLTKSYKVKKKAELFDFLRNKVSQSVIIWAIKRRQDDKMVKEAIRQINQYKEKEKTTCL